MSNVTLQTKLSELQQLVNTGPIFQSVQCLRVFMVPQHVPPEIFDDFVDSLRASSRSAKSYIAEIKQLYGRLLDSGFFDIYLCLHFDVQLHTSYVTVVSTAKYAFDKKLSCVNAALKAHVVKQYLDRASKVMWLRQLCSCDDLRSTEDARYLCFSSVLHEMVYHVRGHDPTERGRRFRQPPLRVLDG